MHFLLIQSLQNLSFFRIFSACCFFFSSLNVGRIRHIFASFLLSMMYIGFYYISTLGYRYLFSLLIFILPSELVMKKQKAVYDSFTCLLPLCKCADFSVKSKYLKVIGEENSCPKNKNLTLNLQQICDITKNGSVMKVV